MLIKAGQSRPWVVIFLDNIASFPHCINEQISIFCAETTTNQRISIEFNNLIFNGTLFLTRIHIAMSHFEKNSDGDKFVFFSVWWNLTRSACWHIAVWWRIYPSVNWVISGSITGLASIRCNAVLFSLLWHNCHNDNYCHYHWTRWKGNHAIWIKDTLILIKKDALENVDYFVQAPLCHWFVPFCYDAQHPNKNVDSHPGNLPSAVVSYGRSFFGDGCEKMV